MKSFSRISLCLTVVALAMISIAWTPWGAIYESARDERSVGDQATDKKISLAMVKILRAAGMEFAILGIGRSDYTDQTFRDHIHKALEEFREDYTEDPAFLDMLY